MTTQATATGTAGIAERSRRARLFVVSPDLHARAYPLHQQAIAGRSRKADLVIDDARVSGRHARFSFDGTSASVSDLDSSNGVFVNGSRVDRAEVRDGDVVRLGDSVVVVEVAASDVHVEACCWRSAELDRQLARCAAGDDPVLLLGPTGAGKGWACEQIVARSARRGPMVHVNCAALPEHLIEAELFGSERGAFTGADRRRDGLLQAAHGGTLFLDELGELPPHLQARLLVALEAGEVRRVGSTRVERVDIRCIAATNVHIDDALASGRVRDDLYYRLARHIVRLPSLAERRADIPLLLVQLRGNPPVRGFHGDVVEALMIWSWPGNIRELAHVAAGLPDDTATLADLPDAVVDHWQQSRERPPAIRVSPGAPTAAELQAWLEEERGNVSALARRLDKHRNQVVRWLEAYGLR